RGRPHGRAPRLARDGASLARDTPARPRRRSARQAQQDVRFAPTARRAHRDPAQARGARPERARPGRRDDHRRPRRPRRARTRVGSSPAGTRDRMAVHSYEVKARSSAPPERIFALLTDATSWPRWAGPVIAHGSWEREGDPPPGGLGAIRKVGRWPQFGREEIVAHEPPTHHAYT